MNASVPTVSIGFPVFNGENTLRVAFESLLDQSFSDIEIIVSDNASTDGTAALCQAYASRDDRIHYIRQPENIGAFPNFKFVLEKARSPYFMWWGCDDVRSKDFLAENVSFLQAHPEIIASTSPNCFEGQNPQGSKLITFAINGNIEQRFNKFLDHCWHSHGIFYAVVRTDVLRSCDQIGEHYLGADWAVDLYLASIGNINRTEQGLMISGAHGASSGKDRWSTFRHPVVGWVLPFYEFSRYAMKLSSEFSFGGRVRLFFRLLGLNLAAANSQLHSESMSYYRAYIARMTRCINKE